LSRFHFSKNFRLIALNFNDKKKFFLQTNSSVTNRFDGDENLVDFIGDTHNQIT